MALVTTGTENVHYAGDSIGYQKNGGYNSSIYIIHDKTRDRKVLDPCCVPAIQIPAKLVMILERFLGNAYLLSSLSRAQVQCQIFLDHNM